MTTKEDDESFELIDKTKVGKLVLYESPAIADLRKEITSLKWQVRQIGYMNMIGRAAWVLFNPNEIIRNLVKEGIYRITHSAVYHFIL